MIYRTYPLDAPVEAVGLVKEPKTGLWTYAIPKYKAAGWHNDTAPLGKRGNTVLNGHNNIEGKVFLDLVDIKKGDLIAMNSGAHVESVGLVAGGYDWRRESSNVQGWDMQHWLRVRWVRDDLLPAQRPRIRAPPASCRRIRG